jgi:hypothetical protein
MNRAEVMSLLGKEEPAPTSGYLVSSMMDSLQILQIEYENDRVKCFRLRGFNRKGPWQTTNALWSSSSGFTPKYKLSTE